MDRRTDGGWRGVKKGGKKGGRGGVVRKDKT